MESLTVRVRRSWSTFNQLGFSSILRIAFNYPEANQELRSTAWLDGLRGLAAFEVFIYHYAWRWIDTTTAWGSLPDQRRDWYYLPMVRTFYNGGGAAVCLFFGISGYVLSHRALRLMRQKRQEELLATLSSALLRRGIRLYMPIVIETFGLMLVCRYLGVPKPNEGYESAPTFLQELKTWCGSILDMMLPLRYPDRAEALNNRYDGGISWTLPLEYYGSLCVFTAILLVSYVHSTNMRRILMLCIVMQSFAKDDWVSAQFVMGVAFADYQLDRQHHAARREAHKKRKGFSWLRSVMFSLLFLLGFYLSGLPGGHLKVAVDDNGTEVLKSLESRPGFDWITMPVFWLGLYKDRQAEQYILCLAAIASLVGVGETTCFKRLLVTRPIQYLGRISFGLYLCHIPWRTWLEPLRIRIVFAVGLDGGATFSEWDDRERMCVAYMLFMIPATVVNLLCAGLFQRYMDQPSVAAGKSFERWCLSWKEESPEEPLLSMQVVGGVDRTEA